MAEMHILGFGDTAGNTPPMPNLNVTPAPPGRIDHPNFEDVYKTTYAKGVIGDGGDGSNSFFWFITPGKNVMSSFVKVKGDWGVSDFIPLFYCQKDKYWDTNGTLATHLKSAERVAEELIAWAAQPSNQLK